MQFNIKLNEATSKLKYFLLINIFELKILTGTVIIKEKRIKVNNICKNSIIFTEYNNSFQFYLLSEILLEYIYFSLSSLFANPQF